MIRNGIVAGAALLTSVLSAGAQTGNLYLQTSLVSNVAGVAPVTDPNLVDPWGVSFSGSSPFWVSNHLSGTSTLYNGSGAITATVVTVPPGAASATTALGRPTGQVQNLVATAFLLANAKASSFIFDTEDGTISAWNGGTLAAIMVDNSARNAVYKGLAIGTSTAGATLYAANFRSGKIDVIGPNWAPVTLAGSFTDPGVPAGFAPFNIWNLNNSLYVTYAKQDASQFLDVAGAGNGYVSVFDQNGNLTSHLVAANAALNSPWGVAIAPAGWGAFGGDVLVGNFGDGRINAFDPKTGALLGTLKDSSGNAIAISGLWAIIFGNGGRGGDYNTLYFLAGVPNGSSVKRGLLGSIAPPASITSVVNAASQAAGPVSPGEIVVINGQSVGPSPLVGGTIPTTGSLPNAVAPLMGVTFNGIAAPIIYGNGSQTSVQVPYEVVGSASASVVVKNSGQTTAAFTVPIAATAPGLFTIDFSGKGQIVALNADGSVNSTTNRAAAGSMIWIFATGEGVTNPPESDGAVQADMTRVPVASVSVSINGSTAPLGPEGSTPRDVSGVLEMQVTIPKTTPSGSATVALTIGGVTTTQATNIFVQ